MDRNGLRPMRYVITGDGLLVVGSEAGMVKIEEASVVEKGRLGPGQMIAVDLKEGRLYHDRELKDKVAALRPFGKWPKKIEIGRAPCRERVCQYVYLYVVPVT